MGVLALMYLFIILITVVLQVLLYKYKDTSKYSNLIYIINTIFAVILSLIVYTSLPSNYIVQKIIGASFGILAIVAILIKFGAKKDSILTKAMITISIAGSIVQLVI